MDAFAAVGVVVERRDFEGDGPVDCSDGGSVDGAGVEVVGLVEAGDVEGGETRSREEEPEILEIVGARGGGGGGGGGLGEFGGDVDVFEVVVGPVEVL